MPATAAPNTRAIGTQIVAYLAALTYPSTLPVYSACQLEEFKDLADNIANGNACVEVYGNMDNSERRGFGGRIWDEQTWFILSMCSLDTPALAAQIYDIRDIVFSTFQQHATLGTSIYNLFHAQPKSGSGRFLKVFRNGEWARAHLFELETRQEWQVIGGIIS